MSQRTKINIYSLVSLDEAFSLEDGFFSFFFFLSGVEILTFVDEPLVLERTGAEAVSEGLSVNLERDLFILDRGVTAGDSFCSSLLSEAVRFFCELRLFDEERFLSTFSLDFVFLIL